MHLAIDAYGVDSETLADEILIADFLDSCPGTIGMTKIMAPQVYTYRGKEPRDWGVSGFVIIAESHISVHTFPERGYLSVDIFSCKDFDRGLAEDDVRARFGASDVRVWLMDRGVDHDSQRTMYGTMVRERVGLRDGRRKA